MPTKELLEIIDELAEEDMLAEEAEIYEVMQRIAEHSVFRDEI